MKSLKEFVNEQMQLEAAEESKNFTFDFTDIENGEETVKSLEEKENVSIEDQKVTVTIKKDVNIDTVQDILQQAIQVARKSQKSVNDETYAQKTAKLEKTLGEMNEFIDKVNNPEDDKQDDDKKGEEE